MNPDKSSKEDVTPIDMTLRDYFAACALTALVRNSGLNPPDAIAEYAYEYADAMLAERAKGGGK